MMVDLGCLFAHLAFLCAYPWQSSFSHGVLNSVSCSISLRVFLRRLSTTFTTIRFALWCLSVCFLALLISLCSSILPVIKLSFVGVVESAATGSLQGFHMGLLASPLFGCLLAGTSGWALFVLSFALFTLVMKSIFSSSISSKRGSWFNFLAVGASFRYAVSSHARFLSKRLWLEPCFGDEPGRGSFYYARVILACQGVFSWLSQQL